MRKVLAITKLTLRESIRTKIAIAFIILLTAMLTLIVSTATGDGTLSGKIQMTISYSIGVTTFLLSLLVIFLTARFIDQDIKTMRIDVVVTKPIPRWQVIVGRWLGVLILAFFLLTISFLMVYVITMLYTRSAIPNTKDWYELNNHILVARRAYSPPPIPNLEKKVDEIYNQLKKAGRLPPPNQMPPSQVKKIIREGLLRHPRTVPLEYIRTWKITGIKKIPENKTKAFVTIRFKYEPSKTTRPDPVHNLHSNTILGYWIIGKRVSKKCFYWPPQGPQEKPYRTTIQFDVPVNVIEKDGSITLSFANIDPRNVSVHFPLKDGLEVLIREGSFELNLFRLWLIAISVIVFLTSLSLFCGTFLSFPVAALLTLSVFFIGVSANFLGEAIGLPYGFELGKNFIESTEKLVTYTAIKILPVLNIGEYTSKLIDGRIIDWFEATSKLFWIGCIDSLLLIILSAVIFTKREIGKVIV